MEKLKGLSNKVLTTEQKAVCRHIENQLIEYQRMFGVPAEELILSRRDFEIISGVNGQKDTDNNGSLWYGTVQLYSIR